MIEILESRIAPATLNWTGVVDTLWSNSANWATQGTGVPATPAPGDTLVFDDSGIGLDLLNDTAPGTAYDLQIMTALHAYNLQGNSVALVNSLNKAGAGVATVSLPLAGAGGVAMNGGTLTLQNAGNSFSGNINIAVGGGQLIASGSATAVDPGTSPLGNPQDAGRTVRIDPGGILFFNSSDIFGIDGSMPTVQLFINGGEVSAAAATFNTLGPVLIDNGGTLSGLGGVSATKQMYALTAEVASGLTGGTISGTGAFSGYHLNPGSAFSPNSLLTVSAVLVNQTPAFASAPGVLSKIGPGVLALSATNRFSGGALLMDGTVRIQSNGNLGDLVGSVTMLDTSTIEVLSSITTSRDFFISGTANFIIPTSRVVILNGVVADAPALPPGSFSVSGGGKLIIGNPANTFTGSVTTTAGTLNINSVTISFGGPGTATVTPIPGSTGIALIVLAGTDLTSFLRVTGPPTTDLHRISIPNANDHIDLIQLTGNVVFGDGVADLLPDLFIAGKAQRIMFSDVNPGAILKFGDGLPYDVAADTTTPDTYNNHPDITFRDVMGEGVTIDVTGDGMPAGVGGGGLGKFTVRSWGFPGLVKTTQSIDTFTIKRGDAFAVLEVDKFNVGLATPANVNKITCLAGKWNSAGTAIEGYVDKFDVGGFATGASLTAAYVQTRLYVTGTHLDVGNVALGGIVTLTSTSPSALFDIRVGSFTGAIDAQGTISTFSGTGNFSGTLTADAITVKVQALKFIDNGVTFARITTDVGGIGSIVATAGGMTNTIVQSAGNIGAITLTGSGSTRSMIGSTISAKGSITGPVKIGTSASGSNFTSSQILSGAQLGADGLVGGIGLNADLPWLGGTSIGDVSIYGVMTASVIAASIDPGADATYGNPSQAPYVGGDDIAVAGGGAIGKISLHSTAFTGKTIQTNNTIAHSNVVLGGSINGVFQLAATSKIAASVFNAANTSRDLRSGGSPAAADVLFFAF